MIAPLIYEYLSELSVSHLSWWCRVEVVRYLCVLYAGHVLSAARFHCFPCRSAARSWLLRIEWSRVDRQLDHISARARVIWIRAARTPTPTRAEPIPIPILAEVDGRKRRNKARSEHAGESGFSEEELYLCTKRQMLNVPHDEKCEFYCFLAVLPQL